AATDQDGDVLTYTLGGRDAASFRIVRTTGQLQTRATLDHKTDASYSVTVTASDGNGGSTDIPVTINVTNVNEAPTFTQGTRTTRSVEENTPSGINIGTAVAATDPDGDTLTYTLGGTDASAFSILRTSGQLQSSAALDYETRTSYSVRITVSDGSLTDSITVTITVTDVSETPDNSAPAFTDGTSTTRSIAENTAAGTNIGTPVAATDQDGDTLTYTLGGTDASAFSIISTTGQLQTSATLDHETDASYSISVSVSDGKGGNDSIRVTITVTDVNDAPVFTDGTRTTRSIAENTVAGTNIGTPVAATDPDNDTLAYSFFSGYGTKSDGTNNFFSVVSTSGQLQTKAALDFETRRSYTFTLIAQDPHGIAAKISVTINVTDVNEVRPNNAPIFTEGTSTTRSVAENAAAGTNIGTAVAATDKDNDTLTYTLSGTDAAAVSIVSTTGQLQTNAALDHETDASYSVTVSVSDGKGGTDSITVTINITDVAETIGTPLSQRTQQVRDAIVAAVQGVNNADDVTDAHLAAITALHLNQKSITSLKSGDFNGLTSLDNLGLAHNSLGDISALEHLTSLRHLYLNDNSLSDISALEHLTSLSTLRLDNNSVSDVSALEHLTSLITLRLSGNPISDYGPLNRLKTANRFIHIDINLNNNPPVFADGDTTTRSIAEKTTTGTNIGTPIAATDVDNHRLTYSLGGTDAAAFSIVSTTGQLQTKAALDYETQSSYTVTVTTYDGNSGGDRITVTINITNANDAPEFTEGTRATRSIAEKTTTGTNIGTAVTATDVDTGDTLTYTLGGTDAASFGIVSTSGQLQTSAALDYEKKKSYSVRVSVSDGKGGTDSITVTINVTNVNEINPPLRERTQRVREVIVHAAGVRNAGAVTDIHLAAITSLDISQTLNKASITSLKPGDFNGLTSLTYLGLAHNSISDISALQHLTSLTHFDMNSNPLSDISPLQHLTSLRWLDLSNNSISDISALEELTALTLLDLANNSISDISTLEELTALTVLDLSNNSISDISALEELTALTQLHLSNNSISDISALEELTNLRNLYLSNNSISDISALEELTALINLNLSGNPISDYGPLRRLKAANPDVNIDINLDNKPPVFADGDTATRSIAENTATGTNIGDPISATDDDNHTLTYSLGGTDAASFSIVSTSGQLQTKAPLDHQTQSVYTVTVTAYDGNSGGDRITVTINVTEVASGAPSVETAPVIPDKTVLLSNFPNPFNPETWIPYQLAKPANVTLTIYNMRGVVVRELKLGHKAGGVYASRSRAIHWDGRNMLGEKVATGVYFYTLKADDYTATRKLLIRK
ncbi:hypothetical protein C6503_21535, partial [Candidatus Poribacteria bacterium]